MQTSHFLIDVLRQDIHTRCIFLDLLPKLNLSERLVSETVRHHERWMTSGTTEVHQTTLGKQVDAVAIGEGIFINRTLDVWFDHFNLNTWHVIERIHTDLIIEVTDITNDRLVLHLRHVVSGNNAIVTSGGDVDIAPAECVLEGQYAVAFHRSLQCTNRINFSHDNLCAHALKCSSTAFTHIAISTNDANLTRNHYVSCTFDAIE